MEDAGSNPAVGAIMVKDCGSRSASDAGSAGSTPATLTNHCGDQGGKTGSEPVDAGSSPSSAARPPGSNRKPAARSRASAPVGVNRCSGEMGTPQSAKLSMSRLDPGLHLHIPVGDAAF